MQSKALHSVRKGTASRRAPYAHTLAKQIGGECHSPTAVRAPFAATSVR